MSLVEIVTKEGKRLGTIDEIAGTVTIEEEWHKITAAKKQTEKDKEQGILRRIRDGIKEISKDGGITWVSEGVEDA